MGRPNPSIRFTEVLQGLPTRMGFVYSRVDFRVQMPRTHEYWTSTFQLGTLKNAAIGRDRNSTLKGKIDTEGSSNSMDETTI